MREFSPSRRSFLLGSLGMAVAGCVAPSVRTAREEVAEFPLIDVHSHYVPASAVRHGYTPEQLLRAMDVAGIRRMVVLGSGPEVPALPRRHPARFVASYVFRSFRFRQERGEIKDGTAPEEAERLGAEFEAALRSGLYRGLGEIHTYARPIPGAITGGSAIPGSNIAPDSSLIRRLVELAGRNDVPINIHCDDYGVGQMVRTLGAYPKSRVIWAHAGSALSPSAMREILRDHPNVSFDLSAKNPACCPLGAATYPIVGFRTIDEAWRELFEAHPDRFYVGVDFFSSEHLRGAREAGEFYRTILTQLTPAAARRIGYQNAQEAYRLS